MRTLLLIALAACSSNSGDDGADPFALGSCGSSWTDDGAPVQCSRECFAKPNMSGSACQASDETGGGSGLMCNATFVGSDGDRGCCTPIGAGNETFFECE